MPGGFVDALHIGGPDTIGRLVTRPTPQAGSDTHTGSPQPTVLRDNPLASDEKNGPDIPGTGVHEMGIYMIVPRDVPVDKGRFQPKNSGFGGFQAVLWHAESWKYPFRTFAHENAFS